MGIELFQNNRDAYEATLSLFRETNKTAVILATNTGKSFIEVYLAEDQNDKNIYWLPLSEFKFKTQIENPSPMINGEKAENYNFPFSQTRLDE